MVVSVVFSVCCYVAHAVRLHCCRFSSTATQSLHLQTPLSHIYHHHRCCRWRQTPSPASSPTLAPGWGPVLRTKHPDICLSGDGVSWKGRGTQLTPGVSSKIGFSFVCDDTCVSPLCFVFFPPCFSLALPLSGKKERLTDWGGQVTVQVWVAANPSLLSFPHWRSMVERV